MSSTLPSNGVRFLSWVVPVLLAAGVGWSINSASDRYTATQAAHDKSALDTRLQRIEKRMIGTIEAHVHGGPHDNVRELLTRFDERLKVLEKQ